MAPPQSPLAPDNVRAKAVIGAAERAGVHITTVQRMERSDDTIRAMARTVAKVERALKAEGVDFLADNGGPGVRLKKRPRRDARRHSRR